MTFMDVHFPAVELDNAIHFSFQDVRVPVA